MVKQANSMEDVGHYFPCSFRCEFLILVSYESEQSKYFK